MRELVSVLVAVYNTQDYLERCIDSIIGQTYEKIEVIIVDDGSKDESLKICKDFMKKDSRIKVIHQENGGLAAARNTGIRYAEGEYVCFLDSDDYIENDYIETLYKSLKRYQVDVAVCAYDREYPNGKVVAMCMDSDKMIGREEAMVNMYRYNSFGAYSWNKMFRMDMIKKYGLIYDPELRMSQDLYFSTQYIQKIKSAYYINRPLYHYIYNEDSVCRNIKKTGVFQDRFMTSILAHEKTKDLLQAEDKEIRQSFSERYVNTYMRLTVNLYYSKNYDKRLLTMAKKNIRTDLTNFIFRKSYPVSWRAGALLIAVHPLCFMFFFGIAVKLFGIEV